MFVGPVVSEDSQQISGEELTRAVERSTRNKTRIAQDIGVTRTYLFRLMRDGVTDPARIEVVRRQMGLWLDYDPYGSFSDKELTDELLRRLTQHRASDETTPEGEDSSTASDVSGEADNVGDPPHWGGISGTLGEGPPKRTVNDDGETRDDD